MLAGQQRPQTHPSADDVDTAASPGIRPGLFFCGAVDDDRGMHKPASLALAIPHHTASSIMRDVRDYLVRDALHVVDGRYTLNIPLDDQKIARFIASISDGVTYAGYEGAEAATSGLANLAGVIDELRPVVAELRRVAEMVDARHHEEWKQAHPAHAAALEATVCRTA